jgi:hypothetical protein
MPIIGDFIKIKHGYAFKGDNISTKDNGIVLVTPGNFEIGGGFKEQKCKFFEGEYPNEYVLETDDLIVTMTDLSKNVDTLGYSALVPFSDKRIYLHNQRIGLVQFISDKIDKHYLYWYMRTAKYQKTIAATSSGSTVHHTSPDRICAVEIDVPKFETQVEIAKLLDNIDSIIRINDEINRNLLDQAMALYEGMILDAIEECSEGVLSDIADIVMGQSPKGDTYNEDGAGTVFYQGRAEFGERFPTQRLFTTAPKRMAKENSVLMSVRAPVGDVNVAYEECCIGRGLCSVASKDNHQSFILYTMYGLKDKFDVYNGEGTVFGSINKDSMNCMTIQIPNKTLMDRFEEIVSPMDAIIKANYDENCRLIAVRDSLLPKLMSGELDVSDLNV